MRFLNAMIVLLGLFVLAVVEAFLILAGPWMWHVDPDLAIVVVGGTLVLELWIALALWTPRQRYAPPEPVASPTIGQGEQACSDRWSLTGGPRA